MIIVTPRKTPVLRAVLWDGNLETLDQLPGAKVIINDDWHIDSFGALHWWFDGLVFNRKCRRDIDYMVRGVTGEFFAVEKEEFHRLYRVVEVNEDGEVMG